MDGVLNSGYYCRRNNVVRWLEKDKLLLVKKLVIETNALIVLTSYRCQFSEQKRRIRDELKRYGIDVYGVIPDVNDKNAGIRRYLERHEDIENFVIIDDGDFDFETTFPNHVIQTTQWWGLKRHHIVKAKKLLLKE